MKYLEQLANELANTISEIDEKSDHEKWQPGIGPFEERKQIKFLIDNLDDRYRLETGKDYPESNQKLDLYWKDEEINFEAKLLRFWRDNGELEHHWYGKIFSPFRNSFVNDAEKLQSSSFQGEKALLGIYYNKEPEELEGKMRKMELDKIAKKYERCKVLA